MAVCRDEEQQEVGVMGRENQADTAGAAAAPEPQHLPVSSPSSEPRGVSELRNDPEVLKTSRALEHLRGPRGVQVELNAPALQQPQPGEQTRFGL